jgi:anti-anti-sigma factor
MSSDHFSVERGDGSVLLRVVGDVDFSNRAEFEDALAQCSEREPLTISFLDCTFCDSSIIGALMKLRNARPNADITLQVAPKTAVARVFELVGVDRVFPLGSGGATVPAN